MLIINGHENGMSYKFRFSFIKAFEGNKGRSIDND